MQETERASAREAACRTLLRQVQSIQAETRTGFPGQRVLDTLLEFVERHRALLPDEDFAPPRAHSRMHPLAEGLDTPYGLYLNVTRPGKHAEPHCHGVWSVSAGLAGRELNQFWKVTEQTSNTSAKVGKTHAITLERGTGMLMQATDVHSTTTQGEGETRLLHLFERPFEQFPRVVFYHPAWGTRRALPQGTGRTLRGG